MTLLHAREGREPKALFNPAPSPYQGQILSKLRVLPEALELVVPLRLARLIEGFHGALHSW